METQVKSFILDVITNQMNFQIADHVGDETAMGPGGIDLDSLSLIELATTVEKKYGFRVTDADYETLAASNLGEFVAYVTQHRTRAA